jgi:hypothetical protein
MPVQNPLPLAELHNATVTVERFGGTGEGVIVGDAAMTNGSNVLTSPSTDFSAHPEWISWRVVVSDARSNRRPLSGYLSGNRGGLAADQVRIITAPPPAFEIGMNAERDVSPAIDANPIEAYWGADETQAFNSALQLARVRRAAVLIPAGVHLTGQIAVASGDRFIGAGKGATYWCPRDIAVQELLLFDYPLMRNESLDSAHDASTLPVARNVNISGITFHGPGEWGNGPPGAWATQADFYAAGWGNPTRAIRFKNSSPEFGDPARAFYFAKGIRIEGCEFKYWGREAIYSGLISPTGAVEAGSHYYFQVRIIDNVFRQCGGDYIRSDALGENWVIRDNAFHGMHGQNVTWLDDATPIYTDLACTIDSGITVRQFAGDGPNSCLVNTDAALGANRYRATNVYSSVGGINFAAAGTALREYAPRYRLGIRMITTSQGGYSNEVTVQSCTFKGYGADMYQGPALTGRQGGCVRIDGPAYVAGCELDLYHGVGIAVTTGTVHTCHFGNHNATGQQNQTIGDAANRSFAVYTSGAFLFALRYEGMNWRDHQAVHVPADGNVWTFGPTFGYTTSAWWKPDGSADLANVTRDLVYAHNYDVTGGAVRKVSSLIGYPAHRLDYLNTNDVRLDTSTGLPFFGAAYGWAHNGDAAQTEVGVIVAANQNRIGVPIDAAGAPLVREGQRLRYIMRNATGAAVTLGFDPVFTSPPDITIQPGAAATFTVIYNVAAARWLFDSIKAVDARLGSAFVIDTGTNIALGKPVARSDNNDAVNVPANATDGNLGTFSYAYVPGTLTWTRVDLGAGNGFNIGRVVIRKVVGYTPFETILEKSDDGAAWVQIGYSTAGLDVDSFDLAPFQARPPTPSIKSSNSRCINRWWCRLIYCPAVCPPRSRMALIRYQSTTPRTT